MNTLKPLLVVAVLAGIGYGVYVRINSGHNSPPPGVADGWETAPKVQMPEGASQTGVAWGPGPGPAGSSIAPGIGGPRNVAPPAVTRGDAAPPFNPQSAGAGQFAGSSSGAPPYNDSPAGTPVGPEQAAQDPSGRGNPYQYVPPHDPAAPPPQQSQQGNAPNVDYTASPADSFRGPPDAGAPQPGGSASALGAVLQSARRDLEAGQLDSALQQLSVWYDDARLSPSEQQQLTQMLDQVAGTVVYSTQHLLEAPYEVQPGERLEDIAQRYNVPWQLLAKINGIDDPQSLRPGERLKVVRGPFNALISLEKRQLTLLLDGRYAGRFAIGIGAEHPPQEGTYSVSDKVINPVYRSRDRAIDGGNPSNPLGDRWIGFGPGRELGIHGTDRPENIGRTDLPGSISLSPRDVEDVYDILSLGSKVIIRR
ncbi:MAG TPA: L,D-transpeptidase family protein [Pirellulales bacterium]|nr:L,D-transpeptidase family protein [Pirellulales bacterium]